LRHYPPAIRVLILVFISKSRFKGSPMEVESHHIRGGERLLGEIGQEQRIRHPAAFDTHPSLRFPGGMGCHDDTAPLSGRSHRHVRTIVERAHQLTFRASERPFCGQMQAALNLSARKPGIVFAAHDEREAGQIGKDGSRPILPIQPHQGAFQRELMGSKIAPNGLYRATQFFPVQPVQRFMVVDNSDFSPTRLTVTLDSPYPS